ncbi:MAG: sporulation protein YunB [Clostridia bacterium]|nr:sporulation protein YunB [Clostridia bacterium]
MSRICSLAKRKRHPWPSFDLRRFLGFFLCVALALLLIFNLQLYPGVAALAQAEASNRATQIMTEAFSAALAAEGEHYADLVAISYRADGIVSSLSLHMANLNATRNRLLLAVLTAMREEGALSVGLPLGNLFGGELFSGKGPIISVRVLLAQDAHAHMESEFESAGINQTLHRVVFSIGMTLTVMMPSKAIALSVEQRYPVAETIIVGEVPDAFTQISRLTDDVTEDDIDDVNDFGAHL